MLSDGITMISDGVTLIITAINEVYINAFLATLGVAANITNFVVFFRQGTHDNVNISLLSLAVADIGSLTTGLVYSACSIPALVSLDLPLSTDDFRSLFVHFPRGTLGRIAGCITAFVTLERCLCVVVPLKVKQLITPKVTVTTILIFYTGLALTMVPFYLKYNFGWRFDYKLNRTVVGIVSTHYTGASDYNVSLTVHAIVQIASFFATCLFTIVITSEIKRQSQWREATASADVKTSKTVHRKTSKTVRMVATLATVHIVCYSPSVALLIVILVVPGFNDGGSLRNVYHVLVSMTTVFETINSSMRIVLYYTTSVKFRSTLRKSFS